MTAPLPAGGRLAWTRPSRDDELQALEALVVAVAAADEPGRTDAHHETLDALAQVDPRADVLVGRADGRPAAFALRYRPGNGPVRLLGGVHPDHRGRGIGRALLAWQIADARARFPDAPMVTLRQPGTAGVGALAVRAGFSAERVFLHLRRDLATPIEAAPLPAGLRAVEFTPAFDEAVRRSKNDVFSDHWNGLVDTPEQWRRRQLVPQLRRSWSRLALTEHGEVAAFVLAQRPDEGEDASLPLVGTDRAWRGRGAARALLAQVLAACAAGGATGVALDVDGSSPTGADRLYASLGFERVAAATVWALRPDTPESATMGG